MFGKRRTTPMRRSDALTEAQERDLLRGLGDGRVDGDAAFASDEERRAAWVRHREDLVAVYARKHPGFRPRAWWDYDAPRPLGHFHSATLLAELGLLTEVDLARWQPIWAAAEVNAFNRARGSATAYYLFVTASGPSEIPATMWRNWPGVDVAAVKARRDAQRERDPRLLLRPGA
jgi:hypothetical protein